jgi:methylated-DNA-[protein]-cysteine S-methyltransferase
VETFLKKVASPVGDWCVEGDEQGVHHIYLPHQASHESAGTPPRCVADAARQLHEFFEGRRRSFDVLRAPVAATNFQHDVWGALEDIPFGEVRTYAEVAHAIGRPRAMRAVGNANHANPWPILVPCHRVVAKGGLGGYGGGERVKRFLLELEGVTFT